MAESAKVLGLRELERNLKMLDEEVRRRGVLLMLGRGARPMRDEAKRLAPVLKQPREGRKPGTVRDRIGVWRHRKTPFAATFYVGVRGLGRAAINKFKKGSGRDGKDNPDDPFYWRWQELGNSRHAPQPFLRPAFETKKMEAVREALAAGQQFIARVAKGFRRVRR